MLSRKVRDVTATEFARQYVVQRPFNATYCLPQQFHSFLILVTRGIKGDNLKRVANVMIHFRNRVQTLAKKVALSVEEAARDNPIARKSLQQQGAILLAESREQARAWANTLAPEHITAAVEALLNNTPVQVTTTKSVGCGIKWKSLP